MSKCLPFCLFGLLAVSPCGGAQEPAKPSPAAPPEVRALPDKSAAIPAPRAEPVVPPSPAKSVAAQLNDAFVSVFEHVAPAVVVIDVSKKSSDAESSEYFPDFFQSPPGSGDPHRQRAQSEGSGFIIQSAGYVLTNNHVVAGATAINVRLKDGRQFTGKIVGTDEKTDIAVVKIEAADLPTAELADSDAVRVGEIVCAIGVPYRFDYTFTTGVVSAKGRSINLVPDDYEDYLQTDASINPGNSGGPLVDLDGKVVGMNTLINGYNRGLGFAIPSNMLREVGDQLIHTGRVVRPYIGVRIRSLGDDTAERFGGIFSGVKKGVIVETILPDTPAYKSDLRQADVITEVDGVAVASDRELQKQILAKKVGATVQLTVYRKGKTMKLPITTGELPVVVAQNNLSDPAGPDNEGEDSDKEAPNRAFGLQLEDLTKDLAGTMGLPGSTGVLVTSVAPDSAAARAGINVKDVITSVDDKPVKDVAAFMEAVKGGDPKRGILCYLERPSGKTFVVIKGE